MEAPSGDRASPWQGRGRWSASCRGASGSSIDAAAGRDHRRCGSTLQQQTIDNFSFNMLARLKPGVTPAEAHADVERMLPIWLDAWPTASRCHARSARELANHAGRSPVEGRLGRRRREHVVGAHGCDRCRAADRLRQHRESACSCGRTRGGRSSPCAPRSAPAPARIARELLVESFVLGAAGGALGLVLAYLGLQVLVAIGPSNLPRLQEIAVYPPVLAFTVAVSLASTLVFGSITALKHALHVDTPLSGLPRGSSATRERSATRSVLVVVQVALALVLVVSAALMIRTFQALRDVDPGFSDPATIQTARIWIPDATCPPDPEQYTRMQHEIARQDRGASGRRFSRLCGCFRWRAAAIGHRHWSKARRSRQERRRRTRSINFVSPGYFEAMGTRIDRGTRHDLERHRDGRPRRRDLRGFRSRARGGACGRARKRVRLPRSSRIRGAR